MVGVVDVLGHAGAPAAAVFGAVALFFLAIGSSFSAYWLYVHPTDALRRALSISAAVVALGCFGLATTLPLFLGASPSLTRPSTTARLEILSPRSGEVIRGDPASVRVALQLVGGTVVPTTSFQLVPNEGHIHLYLDGSLVSMTTGLDAVVDANPGQHELQAEFVAIDHEPFQPRLRTTVSFVVQP
jgi:hypothetical protein